MQKFVDRAGRIWIVDIDNTTLRRVKTLTGVHLLEAIDGDLITRLSTDPLLLGDVLFAICKPQADQQQITDEAFGEGLAGNSIASAWYRCRKIQTRSPLDRSGPSLMFTSITIGRRSMSIGTTAAPSC